MAAPSPLFERSYPACLTRRELDILSLVSEGLTNRRIARGLGISEKTVKNHLSAIYAKIGAADRTQAALYALGSGPGAGRAEHPAGPVPADAVPADPAPAAGAQGHRDRQRASGLTSRETDVLDLITQGLTNRRIARSLGISEKTVKNHLSAIYTKIGAADRTQAALYAVRRGLRPPARGMEARLAV
ncbi:response regulator transcription factor [Streptomyces sp. SP18CS02]|uniref:response regulator transcription factor n=1 Tax=Streptomyces sp. SP18CS02 TaxID=3002531 RepID=UPI002E776EE9|nr:response regulator transcription factor [Streptomyces sp. SP18CS02]MEE1753803.1 response regulator transcription factor [Streptomyces sp. SP18CS02]